MDNRKQKILQAIIEQFIETAEPVGSKSLIISYHLQFSPATIRNEMVKLEKDGLIVQPHTSAGRIPTELGYRFYLEELADFENAKILAKQFFHDIKKEYQKEKIKQKIFEMVSILARATDNICFATIPENNRTFYIGISNILKKPEFQKQPYKASQIIEILEEETNFMSALKNADIDYKVKIFIGEENIIPQINSCSIIVTKYNLKGYEGYIGILGPKRMDYHLNSALVEESKNILEEKE